MPSLQVVYTNPVLASVGETEETAREKGIESDVIKLSMGGTAAATSLKMRLGTEYVTCSLIRENRNVIGVQRIGSHSSEIIYGAGIMIETEMRIRDIKRVGISGIQLASEIIRESVFHLED